MNLDPFLAARAIDVTAFLGQWPWRLHAAATAADLAGYADRMRLSGLCVSHLASVFGYDTRSGNENLLEVCAGDDRFWPVVIVNPAEPGWAHELDWAQRNGATGVRIVPGYHGYGLDAPEVASLLAELSERDLPLHVSATLEDHRMRHPRYDAKPVPSSAIAGLLRRRPSLRVILSGLRAHEWSEVEAKLDPDDPCDRVLVDLWFTNGPAGILSTLCASGRAHRFAYGSCTPVQAAEATALQLAAADISDSDRVALCRSNAEHLLT